MTGIKYPLDKKILKTFYRFVGRVGNPWTIAGFGRPPKRQPKEYGLTLFVKGFYGWSYRVASAVLGIPRSSLHWAFKRLKKEWLQSLLRFSSVWLRGSLKPVAGILDSTGISLTSFGFTRKTIHKNHWKLHCFVEYTPGFVWVAQAKPTPGNTADVVVGRELLANTSFPTTLFGDKAYDDKKLFRMAYRKGWKVCMQQRRTSLSFKGLRGKVWRDYDDEARKHFRSRIETIFAGFANRYSSQIRERLTSTRTKILLLWCVSHNMRTINKIKTIITLTYWTVS